MPAAATLTVYSSHSPPCSPADVEAAAGVGRRLDVDAVACGTGRRCWPRRRRGRRHPRRRCRSSPPRCASAPDQPIGHSQPTAAGGCSGARRPVRSSRSTDCAAFMVTVQAPVPEQAPLQPAKIEPAAGVARERHARSAGVSLAAVAAAVDAGRRGRHRAAARAGQGDAERRRRRRRRCCAAAQPVEVAVESHLAAHRLLRGELGVGPDPRRLEVALADRPGVLEVGRVAARVQARRRSHHHPGATSRRG